MDRISKTIANDDDNILKLRERYPHGLHFVVGDTHGEWKTLEALINKICFDPAKDHVYFVGDYNAGSDVRSLLNYISGYYQEDNDLPGFHLIRGNHERELFPMYYLENLPDIIVVRMENLNYYIAHAGMIGDVMSAINQDMACSPDKKTFVYKLSDDTVGYDAPFRQIIWSRRGLYSQKSRWHVWPSEDILANSRACIIHGHTPYCFFMHNYFGYGDRNLFWEKQHVFFSEDLQSFDIDSNIKGLYKNGESYRGLACVCLEVLEEVASHEGKLTIDGIMDADNCMFSSPIYQGGFETAAGDINRILNSKPKMKTISADGENPIIL